MKEGMRIKESLEKVKEELVEEEFKKFVEFVNNAHMGRGKSETKNDAYSADCQTVLLLIHRTKLTPEKYQIKILQERRNDQGLPCKVYGLYARDDVIQNINLVFNTSNPDSLLSQLRNLTAEISVVDKSIVKKIITDTYKQFKPTIMKYQGERKEE